MGFWKGVLNVVGSLPVVGHATAGIQFLAGDEAVARNSLASSTGNFVLTAGAIGGFLVGGAAGAVVGGAAGAVVGGVAGASIGNQIGNKINGKDLDPSASKI